MVPISAMECVALLARIMDPERFDLYHSIFENASDAMLVFRPEDERVLDVNRRACELYGFTREEFLGVNLREISLAPELGRHGIAEVLGNGRLDNFETIHYRRDGSTVWLQVNATLIEYRGQAAILTINRDVTEQRKAEGYLAGSEHQYRLMFECNPQPMWMFAVDTFEFLAVNDAALRFYGYSRRQFLDMSVLNLRPDRERERFLKRVDRLRQPIECSGPWTHLRSDGSEVQVNVTTHALLFEGRQARFVLAQDVTEELRARRELSEREAYYRGLIENTRDLITVIDADYNVRYVSPSVERITGRRPEKQIGRSVLEHVHPDDLPAVRRALLTGMQNGGSTELVECRFRHADGSWRVLEAIGHNLLNEPAIQGVVINTRDITERRRAEEALRESERTLRLAQRAGGIGTWEYDVATAMTRCSAANAALYGRGPADDCTDVSMNVEDWLRWVHPEDHELVLRPMNQALSSGRTYESEFRVIWPDGSIHWLASRGEVIRNSDGQAERIIGINFDFTLRKAAERQLAAARDEALAASRMKSQFVATVSHEIRTPMNGIIGMTGLLLDSKLTPQQRSDAQTIRTSAMYLLEMINDLLDLSRIEAGKMAIKDAPFDLRACLETVPELLMPQASVKKLSLSLEYPDRMPRMFIGNAGRVRQIVLNFAVNGVKFTDVGAVRIIASETAKGIRISVADTGPGIAAEAQKRLFNKFVQVDSSSTRRHGGSGLGLAISKSLAEAMGGTVGVESTAGTGSEFWMELPLTPAALNPKVCAARRGDGKRHYSADVPYRVLVAEDNKVNQQLVVRLLEKRGLRVDVAGNGHEAVEMWKQFPYDLVLMDCQMPERDGYEATAAIRLREAGDARVPIVAVTAHAGTTELERCLAAGMDGMLTKPFQAEELDDVLTRCLPNRAGDQRAVANG